MNDASELLLVAYQPYQRMHKTKSPLSALRGKAEEIEQGQPKRELRMLITGLEWCPEPDLNR
ncbi:hypothetical protein N9C62_09310, partial [Luminiphilus sp.]|nr:hypothetical protein [Luminiphilus sp.]